MSVRSSDLRTTRTELFALLALTCIYLASMGGHNYSIDGLLIYRQALSIAQNFSLHFAVPVYWGHSWPTSISAIGLALLYLPSVFVVTKLGGHAPIPTAGPGDWDLFYRDPVYTIAAAPVHIVIAVVTGYLVLRMVNSLRFGRGTALLALASYGIASPAVVYARGDFPQPALGMWLMGGLLAAQRYRASGGKRWLVGAGGALIGAVLTRQAEGSLLLPALLLLVVAEISPTRWRRADYLAVAVIFVSYAVGVALTLVVNWGRFGSLTATGGYGLFWTTPPWIGIPGVLISPSRGILWEFPLIVLAPLGLQRLYRSGEGRFATVSALLVLVLFLNTALWATWWGGWNWGSRLFVPAWPLVAVIAAVGATSLRSRIRGWLTALLFAGGVLWAIPGTVVDMLGGYAGAYDGTANSFRLSSYPPIGAWQFVHHVRAFDLADSSALDVVWLRVARETHNITVAVPFVLLAVAAVLVWKIIESNRRLFTQEEVLGFQ